jgi:hypothetical protein
VAGKVVYSRIPSVGPDLLKEALGPPYSPPRYPSMIQGSKPDPLGGVRLSGVQATHSEVPGQGIPWPKQGSSTDTCLGFILCACAPRSGRDPMLPRGLLPVT